jgi:hypothetical protein
MVKPEPYHAMWSSCRDEPGEINEKKTELLSGISNSLTILKFSMLANAI